MKNEEIVLEKPLMEVNPALKSIMGGLSDMGYKALIVGGAVRDAILGIEPKDFDIEVYNVSYGDLEAFLDRHGKVDLVGKSFGIIKFRPDGWSETYDFSIPRKENRIGVGHKAFEVTFDPEMTIMDGASRRDFTFNALAYDPIENKIYDYFGGMDDLKNKIIRHTSPSFMEDPLRLLRAMQFQARFDFTIHSDTIQAMKDIVASRDFESLPKERIFEEWMKWAEKGIRHDLIFQFLRDTNLIDYYPELKALKDTPQDKIYHPEGDVEIHTALCLAEMDKIIIREGISGKNKAMLVMAILLHDIGKPSTTREEIKKIETNPEFNDNVDFRIGRLLLIKCPMQNDLDKRYGQILVDDSWIDPIIISDTERVTSLSHPSYNTKLCCFGHGGGEDEPYNRLILADGRNISSKHLEAIETGKLKHGDEVFIGRMTITSNGHEALGGKMSTEFLSRIGFHEDLITPIANLVSDHLASVSISSITARSGKLKAVKRLSRRLNPATIQQLLYVIEADHNGRGSDMHKEATGSLELLELAKEVKVENKQYEYILMGRHLIEEGLKPGTRFGEILRAANEAQENGLFQDLEGAKEWLRKYLSEHDVIINIDVDENVPKKLANKIVVMGMGSIGKAELHASMHIHHVMPLAMHPVTLVDTKTDIPSLLERLSDNILHSIPMIQTPEKSGKEQRRGRRKSERKKKKKK